MLMLTASMIEGRLLIIMVMFTSMVITLIIVGGLAILVSTFII